MPGGGERPDLDQGRLQRRLAGNRIGAGLDQRIDPAGAGVLVGPVHRHEDAAGTLALVDPGAPDDPAEGAPHLDQRRGSDAAGFGVARVYFGVGFGRVAGEARRAARPRHGVPMVAGPAGIEDERELRLRRWRSRGRRGDEAGAAVGSEEAAVGKHAAVTVVADRPVHRSKAVIGNIVDAAEAAEVEGAAAIVLEGRQRRMIAEDRRRRGEGESVAVAHAAGDLRDDPPVGPGLAGRPAEGALARNAPLGIGDRAVLLAPGGGRQQHVGMAGGVGIAHDVGNDDEGAGDQRALDRVGLGHRIGRVGRHDPQRLDPSVGDGAEQVDRLQASPLRDPRRPPEPADAIAVAGVLQRHVRGELVGESADLAAAHGVRLAGDRERPGAGPADAAGDEVAVDDGVDLVGAVRRLVHPLREHGDDALRPGEQRVEALKLRRREAGGTGDIGEADRLGRRQGRVEAAGMTGDEAEVGGAGRPEMRQQAIEQRHVRSGSQREVEVGARRRRRPARIDDDDARAAPFLCRDEPLEEHRVAPGEVRADEDDEIGLFEVGVGAGHHIGAKGAAVAGDGRGHAEARIGVDIGRADEALHQLVGDVVVLGEKLAGDIEGDRVRSMGGDGLGEAAGDEIERPLPARALAADFRVEQPAVGPERLGEGRPLGTEAAEVRRMVGIATDRHGAVGRHVGEDAAADAAIGTGGANRARARIHVRPPSARRGRRR